MPKRGAPSAAVASPGAKKAKARDLAAGTVHFVLAHAAGHHPAGAKHPTLQQWAAALRKHGTVHDALVYPKPFNLMPRLVLAHAKAIAAVVVRDAGTQAEVDSPARGGGWRKKCGMHI